MEIRSYHLSNIEQKQPNRFPFFSTLIYYYTKAILTKEKFAHSKTKKEIISWCIEPIKGGFILIFTFIELYYYLKLIISKININSSKKSRKKFILLNNLKQYV